MRQNSSYHKLSGRPSHLFWQICGTLSFLLTFGLLLTGCLGGGDETAATPAPGQPPQTVLSCTETCAQQGQCGTAGDGRFLILGHNEHPETINHNLTFPVDTPVFIQNSVEQKIQPPNGEVTMQPFSLVALADNSQTGWVANWCIAQPTVP